MKVLWSEKAWAEYCDWQTQDKKTLKRINALIRDIQRGNDSGIGKAEQLKGNLSGYSSKRINEFNRLVYKIEDDVVIIIQCKGHYDK